MSGADDLSGFVGSYGLKPSDYGIAPTALPITAAPAPNGGDVSGGYHITKPPPPLPNESDQSLLARLAVAEGGSSPEGQTAVIRATLQRQAQSGESIPTILTRRGQMQTYWNGQLQGVDPNSPAYQAALKIAQTATPSPGVDSWGSPAGIKKQGFGKMPFDPSTGTMIGGQLFGNGHYAGGGADEAGAGGDETSAFITAHGVQVPPPAAAGGPQANPRQATIPQPIPTSADTPNAAGTVWDPTNGVWRSATGMVLTPRGSNLT